MKLLIGGSPCTHWSIAQTKARETVPAGLGWELFLNYVIAKEKYSPDFFLYENNKSMSPAIREQITRKLGVEPILINSALVSAQSRQRLYWTNIPGVEQPKDRGIVLQDILETGVPLREKAYAVLTTARSATAEDVVRRRQRNGVAIPVNVTADGKAQCLRATYYKDGIRNLIANAVDRKTCVAVPAGLAWRGRGDSSSYEIRNDQKANTVTADGHQSRLVVVTSDGKESPAYEVRGGYISIKGQQYPVRLADGFYMIRKLTVTECKRHQTVPEWYRFPVSPTQAYKMLGNGWTVDVIAHILSYCPGIDAEPLEVFSMYDGMSCGRLALERLGAKITRYYATEIDKFAIQTTQANFPDTIQLGDAFQVRESDWNLYKQATESMKKEDSQ